jgi:hypothetical protein
MAEAQLQAAVIRVCKLYGLRHHHQRVSIGSIAGWPDLVIVGKGIIFRELKSDIGKVTVAQDEWGTVLLKAGQNWAVWRPVDLASGRVQRELEQLR